MRTVVTDTDENGKLLTQRDVDKMIEENNVKLNEAWQKRVDTVLNDRFKDMYRSARSGLQAVAERLSVLKDVWKSECDTGKGSSIDLLSGPVHVVDALDRIREENPEVYAVLVGYGERLSQVDTLQRSKAVLQTADQLSAYLKNYVLVNPLGVVPKVRPTSKTQDDLLDDIERNPS